MMKTVAGAGETTKACGGGGGGLAPLFSLVGCGQEFHADFAQKFGTVI